MEKMKKLKNPFLQLSKPAEKKEPEPVIPVVPPELSEPPAEIQIPPPAIEPPVIESVAAEEEIDERTAAYNLYQSLIEQANLLRKKRDTIISNWEDECQRIDDINNQKWDEACEALNDTVAHTELPYPQKPDTSEIMKEVRRYEWMAEGVLEPFKKNPLVDLLKNLGHSMLEDILKQTTTFVKSLAPNSIYFVYFLDVAFKLFTTNNGEIRLIEVVDKPGMAQMVAETKESNNMVSVIVKGFADTKLVVRPQLDYETINPVDHQRKEEVVHKEQVFRSRGFA